MSDYKNRNVYTVFEHNSPKTGRPLREEWFDVYGHRQSKGDSPAIVQYDESTGNVNRLIWLNENKEHRVGGPALEIIDPHTRIVIREVWYEHGRLNHYRLTPVGSWLARY